jgi:hypothetical protein
MKNLFKNNIILAQLKKMRQYFFVSGKFDEILDADRIFIEYYTLYPLTEEEQRERVRLYYQSLPLGVRLQLEQIEPDHKFVSNRFKKEKTTRNTYLTSGFNTIFRCGTNISSKKNNRDY